MAVLGCAAAALWLPATVASEGTGELAAAAPLSPRMTAVCDPAGLRQHPPACYMYQPDGTRAADGKSTSARHLPNVYGGPSTLNQCIFGHPITQSGIFGGGSSCWTGPLFGFSGIDGSTAGATEAQFVGWFVNGSYSVFINTPTPRQLWLGFNARGAAAEDSGLDEVLVATNDVLLVQRGASKIGVTWSNWHTMVGFVEGPDAAVALEELTNAKGSVDPPPPHLPDPAVTRPAAVLPLLP